ncbi:peptidoglycan DD-metalloendopeptidase family protein [Allorhizocola rhizosphaerae]|uniref:peptidoglycan DD-metalloendopeptidase family protein n=1 Tax=Allorhizocola rhizosphaerae TaxID=1872709 RepID=UPI000E3D27DC|nr:peptidoglycan DD-metalloendopeptidase family protein [Allorhizocola rhizosphaerae]
MSVEHEPIGGGVARRTVLATAAAVPAAALVMQSPAHAAAPNLTITLEPLEGGSARFLKLAPSTALGSETAKLIFRLTITNNGPATVTVTGITFTFPGSGVANKVMQGVKELFSSQDNTIAPGATKNWSNGKTTVNNVSVDNAVYLGVPAPAQIRALVTCSGFADAAQSSALSLTAYVCPKAGGYPMPFAVSDMRVGEVMAARGEHWANGGSGGTQIYAHDVGVKGWDQVAGAWSDLLPGTDGTANEHFRIWNKPVRAVAAGVVVERFDGMPDNTVIGQLPNPTPNPVDGNHLWIQHGTELVRYTHMRNGTIPASLTPGTAVTQGQILGRAGNSGNSSAPHIHLEVRREGTWALRPWAQGSAWMVAQSSNTPFNPDSSAWLSAGGRGIPNTTMLIWPAATKPTWYPPGKKEITIYGVRLADYQTVFNRVTAVGYRPVWFDGYEVGGATFVNAIFRPTGGLGWIARHGMSLADLNAELSKYRTEGIQPVNLASYMNGSTVQYALCGVYQAGPDWQAYGGKTGATHQSLFNTYTGQGYASLNISIVSPGNSPQFSGLYVKQNIGGFVAASWLTAADYQQQWNDNYEAGRYLFYLSACQHNGAPMFSAIFASSPGGSGGTVGRHHLDLEGIQANLISWTDQGLVTRCIAGYDRSGVANFAVGWRNA